MKTKRICKSTVSLLLVFMMLISMITVGIVNTSAAETDTAQTGVDYYTVYFTRPSSWTGTPNVYWWNSSVSCSWPGSAMTWVRNNDYSQGVYKASVPSDAKNLKFNDGANNNTQTNDYNDLTQNKDGVEFYMDDSKNVTVATEGTGNTFGGGSSTTSSIYLAGSFNGWSTTANQFTVKSGTTYECTISLAASTSYTFKVVKDGSWLGNTGTITADVTGWAFTSAGDCTIKSTIKGDYVFTFDSSTNKLGVTYPTETPTEPPTTDPDDTSDTFTLYFRDSVTSWEIESDDAKFFAKGNDNVVHEMIQTIDTISGTPLWYAEGVATSNTSFTFYRAPYFCDKSNATSTYWNTWTKASRGSYTCFNATASDTGSWVSTTIKPADIESFDNFWYGLWVDTKKDMNTKTFVRAELDGSVMSLYLPSYVDLSNIQLYSSFKESSITGGSYSTAKSLAQGAPTTVALQTGVSYTLKTTNDNSSARNFTLKVYTTSDTAAMLLTTNEELFTGTTSGLGSSNAWPSGSGITADNFNNYYKDAIETKGSIYVFGEDGTLVNSGDGETKLKKIKGRGNSSFKGSMQVYGKYAYNFNLDKKVDLTKRTDGSHASTASKKWCLLANNPDVTMMRNTLIYSLADDVGLKYGPETRLVDVYDNGKYLGAYIITEKVEYGKNTLMNDLKSLDDGNTDANSVPHPTDEDADPLYEFDTDDLDAGIETTETISGQSYTYKYYATYDRPEYEDENGNTVAAESNLEYKTPANYNTKYNYLLEFELYDRYKNEASWFKSSRTGQAVVVKYPEFVTQTEMRWIISEYEKAEAAIYSDNTDAIKAAVDVDSFARMYLIQELAINLDSGATSYYIHNRYEDDGTSKLYASPVWDYDWSLGAYAKDLKYIYNGSSVTTSSNMSDPKQMFVKNKALKTDSGDTTKASNYNFQAKLVHNSYVWERCQYYWTNLFVPNLGRYVDNDYTDSVSQKDDGVTEGRMLTEWLPTFSSSLAMNDARWGSVSFTGDDWGTKVTTDYVNRSFDFKVGNCGTSGSATKSYANSVYYLNDWVVTRWNYMSSSSGGNLYREDLKETITADNANFTAVQEEAELTITPSVEITYNGERVDNQYPESVTYEIYVNGKLAETNTLNNSTTITLTSGIESNIYIKAYLTNAPNTYAISETKKFSYGISDYKVENVNFTAEQHDGVVTITPSADVSKDGVAIQNPNDIQYTVYVNNEAVVTKTFAEGVANVNIPEGMTSEIYIKVSPVGVEAITGSSAKQSFSFGLAKLDVTLYFKSSGSARYVPYVSVNGGEKTAMSKTDGFVIGKNSTQTQSYYYYKLVVQVEQGVNSLITFTNGYDMSGTVTLNLDAAATYYYAIDNLNMGSEVVDLTEADEYVRNFKQSATHMVYVEPTVADVATTSIDGTIYKMGDANGDNSVNIMDATTIQLALAEKTELDDVSTDLADYNLSGVTSITDATDVQIYLAQ